MLSALIGATEREMRSFISADAVAMVRTLKPDFLNEN
jgi:hypothetical protein